MLLGPPVREVSWAPCSLPPFREVPWALCSLPPLRECCWSELADLSPARPAGVLASWAESLMLGKCGGRHGVRCVYISPSLARACACWSGSFAKTRLILWSRVGCSVRVRRGMRAPSSRVVFVARRDGSFAKTRLILCRARAQDLGIFHVRLVFVCSFLNSVGGSLSLYNNSKPKCKMFFRFTSILASKDVYRYALASSSISLLYCMCVVSLPAGMRHSGR